MFHRGTGKLAPMMTQGLKFSEWVEGSVQQFGYQNKKEQHLISKETVST
jgi:hypothetical protein